jgi:deoxyribonuclease IV
VRVGVQTSIAGAVVNAVHRAHKLGSDTFQMFSANPRGWKTADPPPEDCERFREARTRYGLAPLAVHDSYLINLASADAVIREKSIAAFRRELERAVALGADYLIAHPGSAKGSTPAQALKTVVESLRQAAKGVRLNGLTVLIENTAGQGAVLGRRFEEVAEIVSEAGQNLPMGACIDTAHCFEAGYAIHTTAGLEAAIQELDSTIGMEKVQVIHANDSKTPFDSHADRHEHIGKGKIGAAAFGRIVRHPKLRSIPFICETPIDRAGDDKRNLRTMRRLAGMKVDGRP